MSVSFSPDPVPPATRGKDFSQSVSVTAPGSITSLSASLLGDAEPITVSTSGSTISLSGKYLSGWQDIFTYVDAYQSDKTDTPKTAINIPNMPPDKNLYDLAQDQTHFIYRQYAVTVTYKDPDTLLSVTQSSSFEHQVFNDLEIMREFMANYNYNGKD